MLKTLGLDDEWDPVDIVEAIEKAFDVDFSAPQAESIRTVGDAYDLLLKKIPSDENNRKCASAMAFYRLRRALAKEQDGQKLTHSSIVAPLGNGSAKRFFRDLEQKTGLNLPQPASSWIGHLGSVVMAISFLSFLGGILVAIAFSFSRELTETIILSCIGGMVAAVALLSIDPGRVPEDGTTLAGLARKAALLSHGRLVKQGAHSSDKDVWDTLVTVIADFTNLPADQIGRETYFLQSVYKKAKTAA